LQAHLRIVKYVDFTAKAARLHGHMHIAAQLKAFAEQHARACSCQAAAVRGLESSNQAGFARFEHVAGDLEQ
jgi:hypothetical protein